MPYQLPPAQPYDTGLRWFLVAVPDETEFVRAALGSYTGLAQPWRWGAEGREPGSDEAAELWQRAIDETMRAWEMNMLDQILGYIDGVETLLSAIRDKPCCDDNTVTYAPSDANPNAGSDIEDEVGDPPATWGGEPTDTPSPTWDGWKDKKCQAANFVVGLISEKIRQLDNIREWDVPLNPNELASLVSWAPSLGDYLAVPFKAFSALFYLAWDNLLGLDSSADAVDAAREDIACAIYLADGAEEAASAMRDAVVSAIGGLAGSVLAFYLDYELYAHLVYEGTYQNKEGVEKSIYDLIVPGQHECCQEQPVDGALLVNQEFHADLRAWDEVSGIDKFVWSSGDAWGEPGAFAMEQYFWVSAQDIADDNWKIQWSVTQGPTASSSRTVQVFSPTDATVHSFQAGSGGAGGSSQNVDITFTETGMHRIYVHKSSPNNVRFTNVRIVQPDYDPDDEL